MKFDIIGLLIYLGRSRKGNFNFDRLSKRPPWGSGLSRPELQVLSLAHGWSVSPDVRMDGNIFVVKIRGQLFQSHSSSTMIAHLEMHMW